jgi:hypothetical protein
LKIHSVCFLQQSSQNLNHINNTMSDFFGEANFEGTTNQSQQV